MLDGQLSYAALDQMESNCWNTLCRQVHMARVLDISADTISVFFIYYGSTTRIERKLIYPSKSELNMPSPYAIECKLDGIAMVIGGGWTEETQRMFVMDRTLLAQFVSADEIGDGDTPVHRYVVYLIEMDVSVRQRLLDSVNNLPEDSEEAEDNESDDTVITDLTQVADACELLRKDKLKLLTKDMYEYYTSHTTSDYRVGVDTFCAAKFVKEESWCRGRITSIDEDDVDGNSETDDVSSVQSPQKMFAILQTQAVTRRLSYEVMPSDNVRGVGAIILFTESTCHSCLFAEVNSDTPLKPGETLEFVIVMPLVLPHNLWCQSAENVPRLRVRMIKYLQFRFTELPMQTFME